MKEAEYEVTKQDAPASVSEWRHRKQDALTRLRLVHVYTAQPCWFAPAELVVYEIELDAQE